MARLLCCGEVIVEMVAQEVGQKASQPGVWLGPFPSGAPAILADQAALCGLDVRMVGSVGADGFGELCRTRLTNDGVDVSHLDINDAAPTGTAFVSYAEDGSRSFIFHVADSASGNIRPANMEEALDGVDCVHIMGSSAFSSDAVEVLLELAQQAKATGMRLSFDPNLRKEMLTDPGFVAALKTILSLADVVLASEGELSALMGGMTDHECVDSLLAESVTIVVLKRGAQGASLYRAGAEPYIAPGLPVEEVDATGAGDCFGGTFLALWLQGYDPAVALEYANTAGAFAVTQKGPMSGNRSLADLLRASEMPVSES